MPHDQGIGLDNQGQEQPKDKERAQTVHSTDKGKMPDQKTKQDNAFQK